MNDGELKVKEFNIFDSEEIKRHFIMSQVIVDELLAELCSASDYVMHSVTFNDEAFDNYTGHPNFHNRKVIKIKALHIEGTLDARTTLIGKQGTNANQQMKAASVMLSDVYLTDDIMTSIRDTGPTVNPVKVNLCKFFNINLMSSRPIDITFGKETIRESYRYT